MEKIISFLKKIGLLHVSSGDYGAGKFDNRKNVGKKDKTVVSAGAFVWNKTTIVFAIIILIGLIFVIKGLFLSGNQDSDPLACRANKLERKTNDRLTFGIFEEVDDTFLDKSQDSYALGELEDLMYGYNVEETLEGEYILQEICDGDRTLTFANLHKDDAVFYQAEDDGFYYSEGNMPTIGGNYTHFGTDASDDEVGYGIEEPGTYQIYVYASTDDKKWYIAHEAEIVIK